MRRKYANETGSFQERLFKHLVVKQEERDGKLHEGPGVGPLVQAAGLLKDQHNATQLWPALTVLPEEDGSKDCSCQQGHQVPSSTHVKPNLSSAVSAAFMGPFPHSVHCDLQQGQSRLPAPRGGWAARDPSPKLIWLQPGPPEAGPEVGSGVQALC